MAEPKETIVFSPGAAPRQKPKPRRSLLSLRCCLMAIGAVTVLFVGILFIFGSLWLVKNAASLIIPHSELVHKPESFRETSDLEKVRPLINRTALFDVRATVWLDVTQHLKEEKRLPADLPIVKYKVGFEPERSEAILFSDLIFTNVNMSSYVHSSTRLRLPIEPLYSQTLGTSTLRATFQVVPKEEPVGLQLQSNILIYPPMSALGPRAPNSRLIKGITDILDPSIDDALEQSGLNIDLLTLLRSQWRLNGTDPNVASDFDSLPHFFDASSANRDFLHSSKSWLMKGFAWPKEGSHEELDRFLDNDHRLLIPHIRTRSRVIMIAEDRIFSRKLFEGQSFDMRLQYANSCPGMASLSAEVDTSCKRPFSQSIYENVLYFSNMSENTHRWDKSRHHVFYAPFIAQQTSASSLRHHRTIPRHRPDPSAGKHHDDNLKADLDDSGDCLVPMLQVDDSEEYFEFDWDIVFSAQGNFRSNLADNSRWMHDVPPLKDLVDDGKEIRLMTSLQNHRSWLFHSIPHGDRERADTKPWFEFLQLIVVHIISSLNSALYIAYWLSRRTTQGLSMRGQWTSLAASIAENIIMLIDDKDREDWYPFAIFILVSGTATIWPQLTTLLRLERTQWLRYARRRPNAKERASDRLDSVVPWRAVVVLCIVTNILLRLCVAHEVKVLPPGGCYRESVFTLEEVQISRFKWDVMSVWDFTLSNIGAILQIVFNARSRTFAGQFKVAAALQCANTVLEFVNEHMDGLGRWRRNRPPLMLAHLIGFVPDVVLAYQALTLPGIPQRKAATEDDDDL